LGEVLKVHVWRGKEDGGLKTYSVPARENQTVLDAITYIQRHLEPALAYRFACRVGVCGSCAMTVNGKPRWTCRTHVRRVVADSAITVEPLRNMPRIKDLVCDMSEFFQKWVRAGGRFKGKTSRRDKPIAIDPASQKRRAADAAIECINCGICYSACDVVTWKPDYLGPAALNRAWTLVNDERHTERAEIFRAIGGKGGCNNCHTQGGCVEYCPVGLSPVGSISGLKRMTLIGLFTGGPV